MFHLDSYVKTDDGYDIGPLPDLKNTGVSGHVFIVDDKHITIKNLNWGYKAPGNLGMAIHIIQYVQPFKPFKTHISG